MTSGIVKTCESFGIRSQVLKQCVKIINTLMDAVQRLNVGGEIEFILNLFPYYLR